jgi:peroxiredoxin
MFRLRLVLTAGALFAVPGWAQEQPKPPVKPVANAVVDKLAQFKTADELWEHFQALQRGPRGEGKTPEEREKAFREFVVELKLTADRFAATYPQDPRRWEARLIAARLGQRVRGTPQDEVEKLYREAAAAADAPVATKRRARLGLIHMHRDALKDDSARKQVDALEAEIAGYAKDFPEHDSVVDLQLFRYGMWEKRDPAKATAVLKEVAKGESPEAAKDAAAQLRLRDIQKTPLALKFTALDGREVDLEKLRGKVVLLLFWAVSVDRARDEVPKVLATYEKLHDQGLEVVGVAMDKEKEKVQGFVDEKKLPWPNHFDGKGMKNEIGRSFAVRSVPVMWLINKQGKVVFTDAGGELDELAAKLLAE